MKLMMVWRGFRPRPLPAFLGCDASAARTLEGRRGLRNAVEAADDPQAALVIGHEHEAACLRRAKLGRQMRCRLSLWVNSSLLRNTHCQHMPVSGHFPAPLFAVPTRVWIASGTMGQGSASLLSPESEKAAAEPMRLGFGSMGTP